MGVEIYVQPFLTPAMNAERLASRHGWFTHGKTPRFLLNLGWVGLIAGLYVQKKGQIICPWLDSNHVSSSPQQSHSTDDDIPAPILVKYK
jgi:hypothetical protein